MVLAAVVSSGSFEAHSKEEDSVRIVSITPSSGVQIGVGTTFTVVVAYDLKTADQADISLCFNDHEHDSYSNCDGPRIQRGSGELTLTKRAVPTFWGEDAEFNAWVFMDYYPDTYRYLLDSVHASIGVSSAPRCMNRYDVPGSHDDPAKESFVGLHTPRFLGALDRKDLDAEICDQVEPLRACLASARERGITSSGVVVARTLIAQDGSVYSVDLAVNSLRDSALGACVQDQLLSARFAAPPGGSVVDAWIPVSFGYVPGDAVNLALDAAANGQSYAYQDEHLELGAAPAALPSVSGDTAPSAGSADVDWGDPQARDSSSAGDPIILGAVEAEDVHAVIHEHLSPIRGCYQEQLTRNPNLYGKVVVKFVIAKDGSVSSAKINSTSMNNPLVESCLCQEFMTMRFTRPVGGGIAVVTYPFVFKST